MAYKVKTVEQIYFSKDHQMIRRAVAEFVKKEINPNVDQWEEDEIAPLKNIFRKMGDLGFPGIRYDPKHGGLGYMKEMLISRYYRDARGLAIGGGADEVMREVIIRPEGL